GWWSGPDVLFLYQMDEDGAVIDIPKAAINNNFLDLTNILAEDPDFTKDNYIDGVLESGQFGGRQYLIPTSCDIPLIVSSAEKLKELVFDWNDVETMSDYLNALAELTPKAKENPSFSHMLSSKNYFIPFLMLSGIQLIDYENGVVLPEEKDLREFLKAYKSFFPYDYEENGVPWFYNLGDDRLISGRNVFWFPLDLPGFASSVSVMKNKSCDFEIHTILGQQSENTTTLSGTLAINANAENSLNAYRFIKFMLSEETQKDPQTLPGYLPIHKECIRKIVSTAPAINANDNMTYDYDHTALTTEEAEMVCEMLMDIDRFVHPSPILNNMVFDSMLPYFRDEDSYKNCLDELRSKLKFYLSE
ncbi:MAG: carbohydrate ABC transporter substrate-binding protein, partial [Ruminococcaceae bacterium]|nr:carbohydrate ABC transporter substrate-binding protein [Oscillospiraceae bacterium]